MTLSVDAHETEVLKSALSRFIEMTETYKTYLGCLTPVPAGEINAAGADLDAARAILLRLNDALAPDAPLFQ